MPEPFGYVSDWFGGDGMRFQHKPWPELHCLTHSVAAVYSTAQMQQAIADAHTAGRDQGLREAKEVLLRTPHDADVFAAIEQLRA